MNIPMTQPIMSPMMNMNMNPNSMIESIKSMAITMAMVKSTNSTDSSQNSIINMVLLMIVVSFIDTIINSIKYAISMASNKFSNYITSKTKNIPLISNDIFATQKKSSIVVKIEPASKNPTSDAIIDLLTNLPQTKSISLQSGIYAINYNDEIEISKNLYAKMCSSGNHINENEQKPTDTQQQQQTQQHQPTQPNTAENNQPVQGYGYISIYSYTLNMENLRIELDSIVKNYLIKITNKLGNNIYYFSEMPTKVYRDSTGQIDYSKIPETLYFSMKKFTTNRSFNNLFGKNVDIIRKRVNFFKDNKDWYDSKGVPYTLGIMVSGNPGSGKTSMIKCISNELKRHIINIHLSDNMTKTQLENLFYSEQINILQNGKTETYTIPINKRIYVLEDVDCQCDVILDRETETAEKILIKKNEELKNQIEELKKIINDRSNQVRVVGNQQNDRPIETNNQKITLSFLLNLFDGILETPGRITIMTTNFVDKLDKAFTRPGRIDIISKFGFSDSYQLIQIIEHRYDIVLNEEQLNFIYNIPKFITPAEIGRILFENFDSLDGALRDLETYSNEYHKKIENEFKELQKKIENEFKETQLQEKDQEKEKKELNESTTDESDDPDDLLNTDNKPNVIPTNNSVSMVINPDKNVSDTFKYKSYKYKPYEFEPLPSTLINKMNADGTNSLSLEQKMKLFAKRQLNNKNLVTSFDEGNLEGFDGMMGNNYANF
jgi:hypothetical protein